MSKIESKKIEEEEDIQMEITDTIKTGEKKKFIFPTSSRNIRSILPQRSRSFKFIKNNN